MELNDLRYRNIITGKKANNIENNKLPMAIKSVSDVIRKIKNIRLKNAIMEYGTHSIKILSFSNSFSILIHNLTPTITGEQDNDDYAKTRSTMNRE